MEISWKKNFAIIWSGQAVSLFTSAVIQMAIIWYLTDRTKSASILTLATLVGFLPQAILGPFIGVLIDRYDRRKIMIYSDLSIALITLLLALSGFGRELSIILIMIVLCLRSIATAFHAPSLQAVTPMIVPKESLVSCAGYSQGVESFSLLLSPAVAALLYSLFDISLILLLDIAGAIFAMLTIILAKIPKAERDLSEKMPHILTEAKEGLHALHRQKGMTALVVLNAVYAIIYFPIGSLYPLLCMSYFGGTFKESSIVEIVFSAGTLLGALILGKWGSKINQITVILISIVVMGAGLILTGSLRPDQLNVFIVLAGIMGITIPFYHGVLMSIFQIKIDESYLGRVLSLSASLGMVAMPIGLVLAGTFADVMGVEKWFFISGILTLFVAVAFYSMPTIRNCCKKIEMDTK